AGVAGAMGCAGLQAVPRGAEPDFAATAQGFAARRVRFLELAVRQLRHPAPGYGPSASRYAEGALAAAPLAGRGEPTAGDAARSAGGADGAGGGGLGGGRARRLRRALGEGRVRSGPPRLPTGGPRLPGYSARRLPRPPARRGLGVGAAARGGGCRPPLGVQGD